MTDAEVIKKHALPDMNPEQFFKGLGLRPCAEGLNYSRKFNSMYELWEALHQIRTTGEPETYDYYRVAAMDYVIRTVDRWTATDWMYWIYNAIGIWSMRTGWPERGIMRSISVLENNGYMNPFKKGQS